MGSEIKTVKDYKGNAAGLEERIEVPEKIVSELHIQEGDKKYEYIGSVENIKFSGLNNIFGSVGLKKIERKDNPIPKKKRISVIPWRVVEYIENQQEEIIIWKLENSNSHSHIIYDGKVLVDRNRSGYRCDLIGKAATERVMLSDELLDEIFEPI
ncbi:hypothetical protein HZA33_02655, partial [Candidatus Pacearchaeota archaeon]|nr:hypothetical protein [Candidatus Pacearchaeota archaeon]